MLTDGYARSQRARGSRCVPASPRQRLTVHGSARRASVRVNCQPSTVNPGLLVEAVHGSRSSTGTRRRRGVTCEGTVNCQPSTVNPCVLIQCPHGATRLVHAPAANPVRDRGLQRGAPAAGRRRQSWRSTRSWTRRRGVSPPSPRGSPSSPRTSSPGVTSGHPTTWSSISWATPPATTSSGRTSLATPASSSSTTGSSTTRGRGGSCPTAGSTTTGLSSITTTPTLRPGSPSSSSPRWPGRCTTSTRCCAGC